MKPDDVLAANRAEESPMDVWGSFVIPQYFSNVFQSTSNKPKFFIGGRGCGKTMLLRFLSHYSQFSKTRKLISKKDIERIGIYWRIDTQFANAMYKHGFDEGHWVEVLQHYFAINISKEVLVAIKSVAVSSFSELELKELNSEIDLSNYATELKGSYLELISILEKFEERFFIWFNNIGKISEPIFLPGVEFVSSVIKRIQNDLTIFNKSIFHLYIDEYENLLDYQQRYFNTLIKHSEMPLVINVAAKRNGISTSNTLGDECIQDIADYRKILIDEALLAGNFEAFASEVLIRRLKSGSNTYCPDVYDSSELSELNKRLEPSYQARVIDFAKTIFPSYSQEELADVLFRDAAIVERILAYCQARLQFVEEKERLKNIFAGAKGKCALIIFPALFARDLMKSRIFNEYDKYLEHTSSEFDGWIQNNFIGCYLWAYNIYGKIPPIYSGFETMVLMSKGSVRHFLELAYKSFQQCCADDLHTIPVISQESQAKAIRLVSSQLVGEIRSFGKIGSRLHSFLNAIGQIFFYSQMRASQSEPEVTHFSIKGDRLKSCDEEFLSEAEKWSVLFPTEETKIKAGDYSTAFEYVLNPIYAAYYLISYRKKRKLEIPYESFRTLSQTDSVKQQLVVEGYRKQFSDTDTLQQTLF